MCKGLDVCVHLPSGSFGIDGMPPQALVARKATFSLALAPVRIALSPMDPVATKRGLVVLVGFLVGFEATGSTR